MDIVNNAYINIWFKMTLSQLNNSFPVILNKAFILGSLFCCILTLNIINLYQSKSDLSLNFCLFHLFCFTILNIKEKTTAKQL